MAPTTFPSTARTELRLTGEHDLSTAIELAATIARAIAHDEDADLVLDLSDVWFMDASTITVILRARGYLRARRRRLQLRDPSRQCRRLLELCQLQALIVAPPLALLPVDPDLPTAPIPRSRRAARFTSKAS
jgi:anti-anti-sigma factor